MEVASAGTFSLLILAGVPGKTLQHVRKKIRATYYPQTADLIGHGARQARTAADVVYPPDYVKTLLVLTWKYVFGELGRPRGFCPLPDKNCANAYGGRRNCGKKEDHACRLQRPGVIVLLYHPSTNDSRLKESFGVFPYMIALPASTYAHPTELTQFIEKTIGRQKAISGQIRNQLDSNMTSSPLLLPRMNFRAEREALEQLFSRISNQDSNIINKPV